MIWINTIGVAAVNLNAYETWWAKECMDALEDCVGLTEEAIRDEFKFSIDEEFLRVAIEFARAHENEPPDELGFHCREIPGGLEFYHEQNFDFEGLCSLLQQILRRFGRIEAVTFQWAQVGDELAFNTHGGGAAYVDQKQVEIMDTYTWMMNQLTINDKLGKENLNGNGNNRRS